MCYICFKYNVAMNGCQVFAKNCPSFLAYFNKSERQQTVKVYCLYLCEFFACQKFNTLLRQKILQLF